MNDWDTTARRVVGYVIAFGLGLIAGMWAHALLCADAVTDL